MKPWHPDLAQFVADIESDLAEWDAMGAVQQERDASMFADLFAAGLKDFLRMCEEAA